MSFELENGFESGVNIKVVGIGGGGNNAVNRMIASHIHGVDFICINTDKQALVNSSSPNKIPIGEKITKGHGAGANPEIGERAAEESLEEIKNALAGADMVFITTGMGGGTGTGAAPIIARAAKEMGILTVGIVTKPFAFEGKRRMDNAQIGITNLSTYVDSLVVIPNERLKQVSDSRITLLNAFEIADDVLRHGVKSISELINETGLVNLDFADVSAVMKGAGYAHMGVGEATGKDKAELAAKAAISSPLLETSISGAKGILISIACSPDIGLDDVILASTMISDEAHPEANIIWGAIFDPELEDKMKVTIIATGFDKVPGEKGDSAKKRSSAPSFYSTTASVKNPQPAKPEAPKSNPSTYSGKEEVFDDVGISDETSPEQVLPDKDFDDLMNILNKAKKKDNNFIRRF